MGQCPHAPEPRQDLARDGYKRHSQTLSTLRDDLVRLQASYRIEDSGLLATLDNSNT